MKTKALAALLLALALISCTPEVHLNAVLTESESVITIIEGRAMAVVLLDALDPALLEGIAVRHVEEKALDELSHLVVNLASVTGGSEAVDGQRALDALRSGAAGLRKTRLVDTLALVSVESDSLGMLKRMRSAQLIDLRARVDSQQVTHSWLERYIDEVRRYMRRR